MTGVWALSSVNTTSILLALPRWSWVKQRVRNSPMMCRIVETDIAPCTSTIYLRKYLYTCATRQFWKFCTYLKTSNVRSFAVTSAETAGDTADLNDPNDARSRLVDHPWCEIPLDEGQGVNVANRYNLSITRIRICHLLVCFVPVPIIPEYLLALEQFQSYGPAEDPEEPDWSKIWDPSSFFNDTGYQHWLLNVTLAFNNWTDTGFEEYSPHDIINENSKVGWLFASKALVQLVANPFIGTFANKWDAICVIQRNFE